MTRNKIVSNGVAEKSCIAGRPFRKVDMTKRIQKAYTQLQKKFKRELSSEEIAGLLLITTEEVVAALNITRLPSSTDPLVSEGDKNTLTNIKENSDSERKEKRLEHEESTKHDIDGSLTLNERQKEVICDVFGIATDQAVRLEDIGDKRNLSRERIRHKKRNPMAKLINTSRAKVLRSCIADSDQAGGTTNLGGLEVQQKNIIMDKFKKMITTPVKARK